MGKPADTLVDDILRSEAAAGWQAGLTAAFFDADVKRQLIDVVQREVSALVPATDANQLQALQQRVIRYLVGLASREARPPSRETEPRIPLLAGATLEDRVITAYPYPIAKPYRALTEQVAAAGAFGCLLDTFE